MPPGFQECFCEDQGNVNGLWETRHSCCVQMDFPKEPLLKKSVPVPLSNSGDLAFLTKCNPTPLLRPPVRGLQVAKLPLLS